ncbi:unnamed protein product [Linum tenue]|uniref:Uncharacterized protein n=1 Tax=Linum tenue TaxID=586396 RepID=A0AAV0H992_9ROSI|nr:unnamed protein product [Linum tenue]
MEESGKPNYPPLPAGTATSCHVVAMPYPGRGHVNPMMNLCKLLASKSPAAAGIRILVTFVVTEEWHGLIRYEPRPDNIRIRTLPDVIPSEVGRGKDPVGFLDAVNTALRAPFELLLDDIATVDQPVAAIVADAFLTWPPEVGNARGIPVASLWTMSAAVLSVFHHSEILRRRQNLPLELLSADHEQAATSAIVDYIPGVSPTRVADLPTIFFGEHGRTLLPRALNCISAAQSKAQYILFTSFYELEPKTFDALRSAIPLPIYTVGPTIPFHQLQPSIQNDVVEPDYIQWLSSQPAGSVLYVSMGSFLSLSAAQSEEIAAGIRMSGVRFLWVSRGGGDLMGNGMVVPWCDQLRVLTHPAVGGFWTHCGWNSTMEAVYAGVPMLSFPIFWDQVPNSKAVAEDWGIGWRVKEASGGDGGMAKRERVAELVRRFMDAENDDVKGMKERARELRVKCCAAVAEGGLSDKNLDSFIVDVMGGR